MNTFENEKEKNKFNDSKYERKIDENENNIKISQKNTVFKNTSLNEFNLNNNDKNKELNNLEYKDISDESSPNEKTKLLRVNQLIDQTSIENTSINTIGSKNSPNFSSFDKLLGKKTIITDEKKIKISHEQISPKEQNEKDADLFFLICGSFLLKSAGKKFYGL